MTLKLTPPQTPLPTLRAIAASGSSGLARKAQAELRERITAELRQAVRA